MNLESLLTSRRASACAWFVLVALCVTTFVLAGCASGTTDIDHHAASLAKARQTVSPNDVATPELAMR